MSEEDKTKKPWDQLTDLEKSEAIARRLGWIKGWKLVPRVRINGRWFDIPTWIMDHATAENPHAGCYPGCGLPNWHIDDGLAFREVWPMVNSSNNFELCLHVRAGKPEVYYEGSKWDKAWPGETWADAICHAAYELLKEME